jgi:acetyl-CoA carboxylase biotin carboxylase subunit
MIQALQAYVILGIRTGIPFLIDVLQSEAFVTGKTFTDFLISHFVDWKPERTAADMACIAYIIDDLAGQKKTKVSSAGAGEILSPWHSLGNWRR